MEKCNVNMYYVNVKAVGEVTRTVSLTAITTQIISLTPTLVVRTQRATRAVPAQPLHSLLATLSLRAGHAEGPSVASPPVY